MRGMRDLDSFHSSTHFFAPSTQISLRISILSPLLIKLCMLFSTPDASPVCMRYASPVCMLFSAPDASHNILLWHVRMLFSAPDASHNIVLWYTFQRSYSNHVILLLSYIVWRRTNMVYRSVKWFIWWFIG